MGGDGDDTYRFEQGFGVDLIQDTGGRDIIVFGAGIARSDVRLWTSNYTGSNQTFLDFVAGGSLPLAFITVGDDKIYVQDQFSLNGVYQGIEEIRFYDGTVLDMAEGQLFQGTDGYDAFTPRYDGDYQTGFNDTIDGGAGGDQIEGDPGDDTYILNPGFGNQFHFDYGGHDTLEFGAGFDPSDLRIVFTNGFALELRIGDDRFDMFDPFVDADYGVEIARFRDGTEINLAGNLEMNGTDGADTFSARADDMLFGHGGDDKLGGGPGTAHLYGGAGNDTLTGGLGTTACQGAAGAIPPFLAQP